METEELMLKRAAFAAAGAALIAPFALPSVAVADPGEAWKKQWEKRAECDRKLAEAKSGRDFYKKLAECNRELAKLNHEQRREALKAWHEAEKKWRERPYYRGGDDWDD